MWCYVKTASWIDPTVDSERKQKQNTETESNGATESWEIQCPAPQDVARITHTESKQRTHKTVYYTRDVVGWATHTQHTTSVHRIATVIACGPNFVLANTVPLVTTSTLSVSSHAWILFFTRLQRYYLRTRNRFQSRRLFSFRTVTNANLVNQRK